MATTVAKYTFSSWLRRGIGANINETDNLGAGTSTVLERATVPVDVQINTHNIHKDFALLSPADVIGVNNSMVVRTEPLNWITDFEPNYLAFIEFYDEGFAWYYTPAKANGDKLRPWVALMVAKEDEFTKDNKSFPLPSVTIKSAALPPHTDTWAWAHVHINEGYNSQTEFEEFLQSLHNLNNPNADKIICRLMSPRKLDANSAYHAFVVPAFETGRQAGLGEDPSATDAQKASWDGTADVKFPVYYEWFFRTGKNEDFEYLVKLLEPRVMDERVGRRDLDGTKPGFGMTVGTDLGEILPLTESQEIIGLEGALKAPTTQSKPKVINTTKPFFQQLKDIVNFPAELQKNSNNSVDPVVSPPIYGENHARQHELNINSTGWLHALNKDPRNRVPSGFGTNVIQKNQENYMARAWAQVQKILEANRKILFTSFAMAFTDAIKANFTSKLNALQTITFFSPLLKKVKGSPNTLQNQMQGSNIPTASVSPAFRKIMRPRGPYFKKLKAAEPGFTHGKLLNDLNEGKTSSAPPKQPPKGLQNIDDIAGKLPAANLNNFFKSLIRNRLWVLIILLIILLIIGFITGAWAIVAVIALVAIAGFFYAAKWEKNIQTAGVITKPEELVSLIENTPPRPNFAFIETEPSIPIPPPAGTTVSTSTDTAASPNDPVTFRTTTYLTRTAAGQDSLEAKNFRSAAVALNKRLSINAPVETRVRFDVGNASAKIHAAVDPRTVFPRQLASLVYFSFNPAWLLQPEHLVPAMAYPDFEDPMYEKLRDISSELLLPNLNLIPQNTISLLVTNPEFIESYMVGLNHEFGKELLWREYPTDKRGSYFRQFWDVKGIINNEDNISQEELTEKYKDIKPLDKWTSASLLGEHNNRNIHGKKQLVMVIRGDLLKKYPNTIIYAQKARIYKKNGVLDGTKEPIIIEVKTEQEMKEEVKFPVFKASIDPDIKFFGFDLTIEQAYGAEKPEAEADDWGYYFVIQQIPGEPGFGMDIEFDPDEDQTTPITWDDMAWDKYDATKKFLETTTRPVAGFNPGGTDSIDQWGRDSASMAYILYQKPVMIAIHAKEMLGKLNQ